MPETASWVSTADPSWHKRVLTVLERDWPEIARQAWSRTIAESDAEIAAEIAARDEPLTRVPMACTECGKPVFATPGEDGTVWVHEITDDYLACPVADGVPVRARVDA